MLSPEKYWQYLELFGLASHEILKPYSEEARKRFTSEEAVEIVGIEEQARQFAAKKDYEHAAGMLAQALELQIAKTFDLVTEEGWRRTVPEMGAEKDFVIAKLGNDGLHNLKKVFSLFPSVIQRLPIDIDGENVSLHADSLSTWPLINKLSDPEKLEAIQFLNWNPPPEAYLRYFSNEPDYGEYVIFRQQEERELGVRDYWVCGTENNRLVGYLLTTSIRDILTIGFMTLSDYRTIGFAASAVQTISDYVLGQNIVPYVCAECDLDNQPSSFVLKKAGFTEYAQGLCTTTPNTTRFDGVLMRRFLKTNIQPPPAQWPISEP